MIVSNADRCVLVMGKLQRDWPPIDEPGAVRGRSADETQRGPSDQALLAAIQYISIPAFVVASSGRLVAANRPGRRWLASQPSGLRALGRPGGPDPAFFDVTPSGVVPAGIFLAVLRLPPSANRRTSPPVDWRLTPREHEVVGLMLRGASNQQIATALDCSLRTVEHHVSSILRKAEVENRTALIVALLQR